MNKWDVGILSANMLMKSEGDWYTEQVDLENNLVKEALEKQGLRATIVAWDDPEWNAKDVRCLLFRTVWDYFERFAEFKSWLDKVKQDCLLLNSYDTIFWNMDKHYLNDLEKRGVAVCPTYFVEQGDSRSLADILEHCGWQEVVIKPTVSGAGRHTYRFTKDELQEYSDVYRKLIAGESMMIQEFQRSVVEQGEISLVMINGKYSHSVLKVAKKGEFRVQDDFGGSVHSYEPTQEEIDLAQKAFAACDEMPIYGRADIIRNNAGELCITELELIEPELWFRNRPEAAQELAQDIFNYLKEK